MLAERQNNCPGLQGRVYYWYIHEDEIRYPILWHEQKNHTVCTAKASRDDDKTLYLKLRSEEIHWIAQFMCLSVTVEHSFVLCLQIMLPCHGHLRVWVVLVANQEGGARSCSIQQLYIKSSSPIGRIAAYRSWCQLQLVWVPLFQMERLSGGSRPRPLNLVSHQTNRVAKSLSGWQSKRERLMFCERSRAASSSWDHFK